MKKKPIPKSLPIVYFIIAGSFLVMLCRDLYFQTTPTGLMILRGTGVLFGLVAGVYTLIKYKKERKQDE